MTKRYNPYIHHRQSIRLRDYDYTQTGAYFVTICARNRESLFGEIVDGEMRLNGFGEIVAECWQAIPEHFPNVALDAFVVMPNHVHGIVVIHDCRGTACRAPTAEQFGKPVAGSLPTIIRSFKSATTRHIHTLRNIPGLSVWQRNYYDHIIRNQGALNHIRNYIVTNPFRWELDQLHPANPSKW